MKNTFQLLTDTINHLQKLADDLGDLNKFKDAAQPELTRDTGKPKKIVNYYKIIDDGTLINIDNVKRFSLTSTRDFYNSFSTEVEAQTEAAYTLASRRVRAFAKAVNGDWKADWGNLLEEKWGIIIDEGEIKYDWAFSHNEFIHQIAFPTEELAAKALELFRPEWEILANP
jgi:hypothetical protein